MSAHTPKPWRARGAVVFGPDIDGVPYLVAGSNAFVGAHYSPKRDEAEANARLIAAAPEMLEALRLIAEASHRRLLPITAEINHIAVEAIAKAEGRT